MFGGTEGLRRTFEQDIIKPKNIGETLAPLWSLFQTLLAHADPGVFWSSSFDLGPGHRTRADGADGGLLSDARGNQHVEQLTRHHARQRRRVELLA